MSLPLQFTICPWSLGIENSPESFTQSITLEESKMASNMAAKSRNDYISLDFGLGKKIFHLLMGFMGQ